MFLYSAFLKIYLFLQLSNTLNLTLGVFRCESLSLEAASQLCSVKKVFLEILQNLPENTCARFSILIKSLK